MFSNIIVPFWLFASVLGDINVFPQLPLGVPYVKNTVCREESQLYVDKVKNLTLWAHEMWDATAKSSTGFLRGSSYQMGDFEQCLTARAPFPTQYCLVKIKANVPKVVDRDPLSLYYRPDASILERMLDTDDKTQQARNFINAGWCVPASCTPHDLEESFRKYLEHTDLTLRKNNVSYEISVPTAFCQTSIPKSMDAADISFCFLLTVVVLLTIISTVYDFRQNEEPDEKPKKKTTMQKLSLAFSAKQNFADLTKADESNTSLRILYGMRTFCIFMIIMDHRFGTFTSSALLNYNYLEEQYRSPLACVIFHGDLFVDTFFILSGLLVAYGLLNHLDKKPVNPAFFIILRYIRLTPVYAFVIFYYATLLNHTGSGPLFPVTTGQDSLDCRANWWTNLLYISNYVNTDHMCMTHSWYLPCDFHFFIIAIGVCWMIRKDKKLGFGSLIVLTVVSMIIPFALTIVYQRPGLLQFYRDFTTGPKTHVDFQLTYSKSHTRATPYFLGMFAGYIYYKVKGTEHHVCRKKSYGIIAGSIAFLLISIFTGAVFYDPYHAYDVLESAFYAALHRPAWALGTIGLLYVTSFGHNPFMYTILTWSPLIPLSKLVYGAYLIHIQFQLRWAGIFRSPEQLSYFTLICLSLSDIVLSFFTALLLYLGIEAPFRNIFKELLMPAKEAPKGQRTEVDTRQNMVNGREDGTRL